MSGAVVFAQSLVIGVSIAAPVGPIGLLVIQRSLQHGMAVGLSTGLGAAAADALYGALGAYGVHGLVGWLQGLRVPLGLGAAVLLSWMAWRTWRNAGASRSPPSLPGEPGEGRRPDVQAPPGLASAFAATFVLTLANPATIVSFIAVFGSLASLQGAGGAVSPALMVAGVGLGSALWWLALCAGVSAARAKVDATWQGRIATGSALVLAAFALATLLSLWSP